jgi:hypothetical protein
MTISRGNWTILAIVTVLAIVPAASAHGPGHLGRHSGFGWSDGYHSRTACPPRRAGAACPTCLPGFNPDPYPQPVPVSPGHTARSAAPLFPHWDKMPPRWQ